MDCGLCEYNPACINGYELNNEKIEHLLKRMLSVPVAQRKELPGLESGREIVIIPGAIILQQLLRRLGRSNCLISDAGLLEGIIIKHASLKKIIEKT